MTCSSIATMCQSEKGCASCEKKCVQDITSTYEEAHTWLHLSNMYSCIYEYKPTACDLALAAFANQGAMAYDVRNVHAQGCKDQAISIYVRDIQPNTRVWVNPQYSLYFVPTVTHTRVLSHSGVPCADRRPVKSTAYRILVTSAQNMVTRNALHW